MTVRYVAVEFRGIKMSLSTCKTQSAAGLRGVGGIYSLEAMWAIRSHTRLLYPNSLSYLVGGKRKRDHMTRGDSNPERDVTRRARTRTPA